jgi:3-methyladenine DNA glycosylase AlkC
MSESQAPALKEMFNAARYRHLARELSVVHPRFDSEAFLAHALRDLDSLNLMQRLRRATESLRATLPADYRRSLAILRRLAPRIDHGFVSITLSDFVALCGLDDFEVSMDALKFFTSFGSAEFAIREFIRRDLPRTLAVMRTWSRDKSEDVRRLASEGSRPRLPWSFRLDAVVADPSLTLPILENLQADPSLYVRKSVANHLNDITKDHPAWVLDRVESWPRDVAHTAWIIKRALRTLIKKGDRRALGIIGAGARPKVRIHGFEVTPRKVKLGDRISMCLDLQSASTKAQRLVIDYLIHYVKRAGDTSAKVFKWKELTLAPGEKLRLARSQHIRDFTTRVHHPGLHAVEVAINGERLAEASFVLSRT